LKLKISNDIQIIQMKLNVQTTILYMNSNLLKTNAKEIP